MSEVEFRYIRTNGIKLHTIIAGPKEGPLIILLHGFPEFWYGWKNQIGVLAKSGYRVVVPDQRGYHLSDKPRGLNQYTLNVLRDDIIGLIEFFRKKRAVIIGHDWGALVAWHIAATRPDFVEMIIPINVPHPAVFLENILKYPAQLVRSSYMLFFQMPVIPEKWLSANKYIVMKNAMRFSANPNTFTKNNFRKYEASWSKRGSVTSMLNWYRALRTGSIEQVSKSKVKVPVRMIWGRKDPFLSINLAKESMSKCVDGRLTMVDGATHWVHHEKPLIVNRLILDAIQS
ncbi:alpha/beta fold hydrolase [Evansella tamaricis]|uniref:Alpha/beta hydrolase n=1 Tax=Evansella tamaricis TaxID=2069301 RepID=A0ABS6JML6_9BACI|nr:alpha/beta hydrolase [Evansella tamaricis]MBU9714925.1 alpha/beta hydrolase [Evansella tamaricis]